MNPSEFVKQINILELYNNYLKSGDVVSLNVYLMLLKELKVSYAHDGSFPVSYTHLDVYKRQVLACDSIEFWNMSKYINTLKLIRDV